MSQEYVEAHLTVSGWLRALGTTLMEANAIAKASIRCADDGSPDRTVRIVLDVEELPHEATTLLNVACPMQRLREGRCRPNPPV